MKFDPILISFVADSIIRHVREGGWIGASWPRYIVGAGALFTQELEVAMELAIERHQEAYGESLTVASHANWFFQSAD